MPFEIKSPLEIDAQDIEKIVAGIKRFKDNDHRLIDCKEIVDDNDSEKIIVTMSGVEIITFSRLANGKFEVSNLQPRHGSLEITHIVLIGLFRGFTDTEIAVNP